ncbi:MAG: D-alanyl-D-alanine carboxypeptidase [Firmicutes bacterium]|nr:D-alanyl-D-alanine carboxypeptidase [Bacillota bacterium]
MKKTRIICLLLALCLGFLPLFSLSASAEEIDQSVASGCHSVDAAMTLGTSERLTDTANAVVVYERSSGTMVYTWNADTRIYPSSMVKIMTAVVALENAELTDVVTVTSKALSYVAIGSVSAELKAGEQLTMEDLLYCMITASANDAATVIAEYVGGSQDAFIAMMNEKAEALGCRDTHYSNVHGLHDEDTYTTARDVCRILDYALDNPDFKTIFCATSYTVPATGLSEEREILTTNYLMSTDTTKRYYDERVTGGKTGATDAAGRCVAFTAEENGMEVLCVVMGAKATYAEDGTVERFGSFEEGSELLDYVFNKFQYRQVFYEGQTLAQYTVENGANDVVAQPETAVSTVLPKNLDTDSLKWVYERSEGSLTAPVTLGQRLGVAQVWYGSICIAQTDMVAANAVSVWSAPTVPISATDADADTTGRVWRLVAAGGIGVLAALLLAAVAILLIRQAAIRARRRKRQKNRRRNR